MPVRTLNSGMDYNAKKIEHAKDYQKKDKHKT